MQAYDKSAQQELFNAIMTVAPNAQVAQAMMVGSYYESRWQSNEDVMDSNGYPSAGPFMMNMAPGNPGANVGGATQAMNPMVAAQYMVKGYTQAVDQVLSSGQPWDANAAALAAYYAEGPALPYTQSQPSVNLSQVFGQAQAATSGQPFTGASPPTTTTSAQTSGQTSSWFGDIPEAIGQSLLPGIFGPAGGVLEGITGAGSAVDKLYNAATEFIGGIGSGETWVRLGEVLLGVVILGGSIVLFVAVLASSSDTLTAITGLIGVGKILGLGNKTSSKLSSAGAGAAKEASAPVAKSAPKAAAPAPRLSSQDSFDRWWAAGTRHMGKKVDFESGDTRESEDLNRFFREQARENEDIARRNRRERVHAADEGEF